MNEQNQLEKLRDIQLDESEKVRDYEQLSNRVSRKVFHWHIPAVAVAIVGIMVFFLFSITENHHSKLTAYDNKQIVKVLFTPGEKAPSSRWQKGVKVTKDVEILQRFNQLSENL